MSAIIDFIKAILLVVVGIAIWIAVPIVVALISTFVLVIVAYAIFADHRKYGQH